jgi:general L-amino acid transport system permease protein
MSTPSGTIGKIAADLERLPPPKVFAPQPSRAAPSAAKGPAAWLRANMFASIPSALLTFLGVWIAWSVASALLSWGGTNAIFEAGSRRECLDKVGTGGACWPGVTAWIPNMIYGLYPKDQVWRVNLGFMLLAIWLLPLWLPRVQSKISIGFSAVMLFPLLASYLFLGGGKGMLWTAAIAVGLTGFLWALLTAATESLADVPVLRLVARALGARTAESEAKLGRAALLALFALAMLLVMQWRLTSVPTRVWGGLFLTLVISGFAITFSLPAGIVLALGRRSKMPVISMLCTTFIELFRSVPLITILFMFNTMLPLFLPAGVEVNQLLRAIVAVCLFASAYMAEIVRGGLQAIPRGQYEAASAMGLGYWQSTSLIIMPQALKIMIPNIVGLFIGFFKDTTLVSIIGLFDLLNMARSIARDPNWIGLFLEPMAFITLIYFVFCFAMSRYSLSLEKRLGAGDRR